jgi:magnesium-transporting ATPase (P-type)
VPDKTGTLTLNEMKIQRHAHPSWPIRDQAAKVCRDPAPVVGMVLIFE